MPKHKKLSQVRRNNEITESEYEMSEVRDENKSSTVNQLQSNEAEDDLHESLVQSKKIVRPKKSRTVCIQVTNSQERKRSKILTWSE